MCWQRWHEVRFQDTIRRPPGDSRGDFHSGGFSEYLDQFTLLGFLAASTSKSRLLTSVMVLPHQSPVVTAKMLASIDALSGGRVIVGCGVGWMREEFEALGAPPFDERGAVADEYIRAFRNLCTSDSPTFEGSYVRFSDVLVEPKSNQEPHPLSG